MNFALCLFIKIMTFIEFYFGYVYKFDSGSETSVRSLTFVNSVIIIGIRLHVINC